MIIDISHHQRPELIDYGKIASQVEGVILRVAYGTGAPGKFDGVDPSFSRHYREFHSRGVAVGAYHYITEYQDIDAQARLFIDSVAGKEFTLGYWCDVELESGADRLTAKTVNRWMELVEAKLGRVGIYTGRWCWRDIMGDQYARYNTRPLWMSAYTSSPEPYIPHGWTGYDLWQYTSSGRLDGYSGNLDMNRRNKVSIKLVYPVNPSTKISQLFGENPAWYPKSQGHNGIDWACAVGSSIYAMRDGVIIRASEFSQPGITDGKIGYGRHIRIQHDNGVSIYGHLSKLLVSEGDIVTAGQEIGLSGGATSDPNSGFSTGPHLHAEYRVTGVPNPVPGGYEYNAIDILPLLTQQETGTALYRVRVNPGITSLIIRSAPIISSANDTGMRAKYPNEFDVYEERNGYGRIGAGRWVSMNPAYVTKIVTNPQEVTDSEKLDLLWSWYKETHG